MTANSSIYASADAAAVTPSDTNVFPVATRQLWIGGGTGTVKVRMLSGRDCTWTGVAGTTLIIQCDMVYSTGTDATGIVAMF